MIVYVLLILSELKMFYSHKEEMRLICQDFGNIGGDFADCPEGPSGRSILGTE